MLNTKRRHTETNAFIPIFNPIFNVPMSGFNIQIYKAARYRRLLSTSILPGIDMEVCFKFQKTKFPTETNFNHVPKIDLIGSLVETLE